LTAHDSFWGLFGWMTLPLSARWYGAIAALSALAAWGWGLKKRLEPAGWAVGMMAGMLGTAWVVFCWTVVSSYQSGLYQAQGRYLFPAMIPFAFLLVGGLDRGLATESQPPLEVPLVTEVQPPVQKSKGMVLGITLFLIALDAWSLFGYILPDFFARVQ